MDRDTIKNLLMTTSVVAIIAGSSQEAAAGPLCTVVGPGSSASFTATSVNCVLITGETITNDVTIPTGVTIGPTSITQFEILDSAIGGGFLNQGTVLGNLVGSNAGQQLDIGLLVDGDTTIGNGVTNAAGGVFSINVANTAVSGAARAQGIGIDITSSSFTGNLVNNGLIDVTVLADPPGTAIADATGMAVVSTSFVGNVINTNTLNAIATAIAGSGAPTVAFAFATARAKGIAISAGSISGTTNHAGASVLATSLSALFKGNITNSGVINAAASANASAGGTTGLGAAATAISDGIVVGGQTFTGNITNSGAGSLAVTLTDTFLGNVTNNNAINSTATAFAIQGNTTNPVQATSFAHAFGIRLVGDQLLGNITSSGNTSLSGLSSTLTADFAANITNNDFIGAAAFATGIADPSNATALATVNARAVGIDIVGIVGQGSVTQTGLGNITNVYSGTFSGNIGNAGTIQANAIATGTASSTGGVAEAAVTQTAGGIVFEGLNLAGNISNTSGTITNTAHVTFIGNVSNSGLINVTGSASGLATEPAGTAITTVSGNAGGISLIGGVFTGNVSQTGPGSITDTGVFTFQGNITNSGSGAIRVFETASGEASLSSGAGTGTAVASVQATASGIRLIGAEFSGTNNNLTSGGGNAIFNGNIINNGQIFATAVAGGQLLVGAEGNASELSLFVDSEAHGIAVLGAVFTGDASRFGSFTGNINNTGTVAAFATAVGQVNGTAPNAVAEVDANADGVLMVLDRFTGNITNTGSIFAKGTASLSLRAVPESFDS